MAILPAGSAAVGQQCSFSLGNDTIICAGQNLVLAGPPGYASYDWSTGSTAASITVGTPGTYSLDALLISPVNELVVNGDFSAGNTGFSSGYIYNIAGPLGPCDGQGSIFITTLGTNAHSGFNPCTDHTTGSGNMLVVNGHASAGVNIWCQTVAVSPNTDHVLSYWATSMVNWDPPVLRTRVNGVPVGGTFSPTISGCSWANFSIVWNSGAATSATICIDDLFLQNGGNDFALDDISLIPFCYHTDAITVGVQAYPTPDLGNDTTLCDGSSLLLSGSTAGATYQWQDGSSSAFFNVNTAGTYDVDVTVNGCTGSDAIVVDYDPIPVVDLGNDTMLCDGQSLLVDATTTGGSYLWQDGSTGPTFNVTDAGTYAVDVTVGACTGGDAIAVGYNPIPVVDLGNDTTLCDGESLLVDAATAGGSYLWQDGSTGPTFNVTGAGTYDVDVAVNGCTGSDAITVNYDPIPVVDLGNDTSVCPGEAVLLDAAQAGATYAWQDGSTASTFNAALPGTYDVDVTVNGCTGTDAITISNFIPPVVDLGADITACAGDVVPLGISVPGANFLWNTGATTNGINVTTSGTYWVEATQNGCPVRDSINVSFTPLPAFSLGNDTALCAGDQMMLDATLPGATYLWSTGAMSNAIMVGVGGYSVDVTVNNCTASDAITIASLPLPVIDLGNDTTLCPGATLLLDASGAGLTHAWQDGSTAATFNVTATGTYSVSATDANGCTGTDAIDVAYASPTAIDLGNDTTICTGTSLLLDATLAGSTYTWSTGATTPTISVSAPATYSVVVDQGLCSVSDAITVSVAPPPVVDLGNDTTLCPGEVLLLDATAAGVSYLWEDGSTAATHLVASPGTYTVQLTNASGCWAIDDVVVAYASPSAVDLGPDTAICSGQSHLLDATLPGASYAWSTGAITPTILTGSAGIYWVEVTQGACSVNDTMQLSLLPLPAVDLGNDTTLCSGAAVVLDAAFPGAAYSWSTGATSAQITVGAANTYSVVVDLNGCVATDAITVNVLSPVAIDLGNDTSFCAGGSIVLDATLPGASYLWSTGATSPTINAGTSGFYSVTAEVSGCSASDAITITVLPVPAVDLGNDTTLCSGAAVVLDAAFPGAAYSWSTGATSAQITVSAANTYSVVVDLNGCMATDAITVNVLSPVAIDLGNDTALCPGASLLLDATLPGATYLWQDGSTAPTLMVTAPGTFSVDVTLGGCNTSDAINVAALPVPVVDLGADTTLCVGEILMLDAEVTGATYVWQDGSTGSGFLVTQAGTYTVAVDLSGCTADDAIGVAYLSPGAVDLGPDATLCPGESLVLDASTAGGSYLWQDGSTAPTYTAIANGTIWVQVSLGACSESDTLVVALTELAQPQLGPDTTVCEGEAIILEVDPGTADVLWSTGSTGASINVTASGTYDVVLSLDGCTASDAIAIDFVPVIDQVDLGPDRRLCDGEEIELDAFTPGAAYAWSTGETTPAISIDQEGIYWVDLVGACASASDTIAVTLIVCSPLVYVPNTFTPDGDGTNDVFGPVITGDLLDFELLIFDRWGERIFATSDQTLPWDGRSDGADVQDGVYVWVIRYEAITEEGVVREHMTGHVTVLR